MAVELIVAPEAGEDIAETYAWYESQRSGLGEEFLSCVDACIEKIRRAPTMYAILFDNYRRALVRRFPYAIFYECSDHRLIIYAVFHNARDPNKWARRLT